MEQYNVTRKKNGQYKEVNRVKSCGRKKKRHFKRDDDDGFTDQPQIKKMSLLKRLGFR